MPPTQDPPPHPGPPPARSRRRLLAFLGLPAVDVASLPAPEAPYAALHARSLRAANAPPMLPATRALAERFYAPHNEAQGRCIACMLYSAVQLYTCYASSL